MIDIFNPSGCCERGFFVLPPIARLHWGLSIFNPSDWSAIASKEYSTEEESYFDAVTLNYFFVVEQPFPFLKKTCTFAPPKI